MGEPVKVGNKPEVMASETHCIKVENDLYYEEGENLVPLRTDIRKMPPHNKPYPRSAYSDEVRYSDWEAILKESYHTRHRLPKGQQTIVDSHASADKVCKEVMSYIKKDKSQYIYVGLDTEKELSTIQFSIRLRDARGPGRNFERNILFQMSAARETSRYIMKDGIPASMRLLFSENRLVFIGKVIGKETKEVLKLLNIDPTVGPAKYVELDQAFNFFFNNCYGPRRARRFITADHSKASLVKKFWSLFLEPGMDTINNLALPGTTLQKRKVHRDHRNNFDLHRGPLSQEMREYGLLDSKMSLTLAFEIIENLLGLKVGFFARDVNEPAGHLVDDSLIYILRAQEDPSLLPTLPEEHRKMAELMIERRPEQGPYFVRRMNESRRWRVKKEIALADLALDRENKKFEIEVTNLQPLTLKSLPIAGFMDYVVDEGESDDDGSAPFFRYHAPPEDDGTWGDWGDPVLNSACINDTNVAAHASASGTVAPQPNNALVSPPKAKIDPLPLPTESALSTESVLPTEPALPTKSALLVESALPVESTLPVGSALPIESAPPVKPALTGGPTLTVKLALPVESAPMDRPAPMLKPALTAKSVILFESAPSAAAPPIDPLRVAPTPTLIAPPPPIKAPMESKMDTESKTVSVNNNNNNNNKIDNNDNNNINKINNINDKPTEADFYVIKDDVEDLVRETDVQDELVLSPDTADDLEFNLEVGEYGEPMAKWVEPEVQKDITNHPVNSAPPPPPPPTRAPLLPTPSLTPHPYLLPKTLCNPPPRPLLPTPPPMPLFLKTLSTLPPSKSTAPFRTRSRSPILPATKTNRMTKENPLKRSSPRIEPPRPAESKKEERKWKKSPLIACQGPASAPRSASTPELGESSGFKKQKTSDGEMNVKQIEGYATIGADSDYDYDNDYDWGR